MADDGTEAFFGRHEEFIHRFVVGFGVSRVTDEDGLRVKIFVTVIEIVVEIVIEDIVIVVLCGAFVEFCVLECRFLFGRFDFGWFWKGIVFVGRGDA